MRCLLNADLKQILSLVPDGVTVTCNPDVGYDGKYHPRRLRKIKGNVWMDTDKNVEYAETAVLNDIANKRVSLGELLTYAEKNEDFRMEISPEDGKIAAYNARITDAPSKIRKLPSDGLIIFRETMPKVLVDAGLADSPAKITRFVYDKICARVQNGKRNAHGLTQELLVEIEEALDEPLAIIRSKTKTGDMALAILTRVPDKRDHLSLVIMQQDKGREDNWVASIYGKEHLAGYLRKQQEDGNLIYLADEPETLLAYTGERDQAVMEEVIRNHKNPEPAVRKKSLTDVRSIVDIMKGPPTGRR